MAPETRDDDPERLECERVERDLRAIRAAVAELAKLPVLDPRTPDEILEYDEHGVP